MLFFTHFHDLYDRLDVVEHKRKREKKPYKDMAGSLSLYGKNVVLTFFK